MSCFFEKLVDKKNDKVELDIIPETNELNYGCIRFLESYRFLSSSLGSLVRTLVDNNQKSPKNLKKQYVEIDEILNIVSEKGEEDRTFEDLKKDYPNEIEKMDEALLIYMCENDVKI